MGNLCLFSLFVDKFLSVDQTADVKDVLWRYLSEAVEAGDDDVGTLEDVPLGEGLQQVAHKLIYLRSGNNLECKWI